jgi:hypothetical protein
MDRAKEFKKVAEGIVKTFPGTSLFRFYCSSPEEPPLVELAYFVGGFFDNSVNDVYDIAHQTISRIGYASQHHSLSSYGPERMTQAEIMRMKALAEGARRVGYNIP